MGESEEEPKNLLMKVKEESEKAGLKLNIQKPKIMTSNPIISQQIVGETMETVADFIFLSSKITVDGDSSHEIKTCLLLGRKAMTNLSQFSSVQSLSRVQLFETPWDSPGKRTGVGCHFLLQGIFPTQGSNPGLPCCRQTLIYRLSHTLCLLLF